MMAGWMLTVGAALLEMAAVIGALGTLTAVVALGRVF